MRGPIYIRARGRARDKCVEDYVRCTGLTVSVGPVLLTKVFLAKKGVVIMGFVSFQEDIEERRAEPCKVYSINAKGQPTIPAGKQKGHNASIKLTDNVSKQVVDSSFAKVQKMIANRPRKPRSKQYPRSEKVSRKFDIEQAKDRLRVRWGAR